MLTRINGCSFGCCRECLRQHSRRRQQRLEPRRVQTMRDRIGDIEAGPRLRPAFLRQAGDVQPPDRRSTQLSQQLLKLRGGLLPQLIVIGQDDHVPPGQGPEIRLRDRLGSAHPGHADIVAEDGRGVGAFLALADEHHFFRCRQQLRQAIEGAIVRQPPAAPFPPSVGRLPDRRWQHAFAADGLDPGDHRGERAISIAVFVNSSRWLPVLAQIRPGKKVGDRAQQFGAFGRGAESASGVPRGNAIHARTPRRLARVRAASIWLTPCR